MTFSEIVKDHGEDVARYERVRDMSISCEVFDTGFVMVHSVATGEDVLTSMAVGNIYPRKMWRCIRSILLNRQRPIVIQYRSNQERLYKASKRYGGIILDDGIVIFPTKD